MSAWATSKRAPGSCGARFGSRLEVHLQCQLQIAGSVDLAAGTGQHAKRLALQLGASRSEPRPVEHVERFRPEFETALFAYGKAVGSGHVLGEVREQPELRVVPGLVADRVQRGPRALRGERTAAGRRGAAAIRHEEVIG